MGTVPDFRRAVRPEVIVASAFIGVTAVLCVGRPVFAQNSSPPPMPQPIIRNTTRFELWRYYEPPPPTPTFKPGDPSTDHIGNRLLAGLRLRRGRIDVTAALQYVQFGGLPDDANGPGALGTGALYFDHSGDTASHRVYLKTASFALRQIGDRLDVQVGRMPYTSGAERASGVPKIEAVKRQRLDSRLLGEFEWSLYQRAFDGLKIDWTAANYRVTASALQPTQGGFEEDAGAAISGIKVISAVVTTGPDVLLPKSEVQLFAYDYDDTREVTARPDNTGRAATAADIGVVTLGGHAAGARANGAGELDGVTWIAGQFGNWYEQRHRAFAVVVEGGYQWTKSRWAPWTRGGVSWFSGDGDPKDGTHGTFFPMLPTMRRYSQSTLYSTANLLEVMGQVIVRPRSSLTVRVDGHLLALANGADGWYAGSGATQQSGRIFGYTLRPSGGERGLMNLVEGSFDWRLRTRWSINGYIATASSGPVVRRSFTSGPSLFVYLENGVQF
jgi:hypothetical protein